MPTGIYQRTKKRGGWKMSDDIREKYRQSKLGNKNPRFGKPGTQLGKTVSEETREKQRKAKLGVKKPWFSGEKHPLFGKKYTKEERLDKSLKNRGPLGSNWQGGITSKNAKVRNSLEFKLWRDAVFERDDYICQKYGIKGGVLHPHHIKNFAQYPELRFAIDNGVTLSEKAHKEFHRRYGKVGNTKEQLEEFLINN
jgi:hypothetical protein